MSSTKIPADPSEVDAQWMARALVLALQAQAMGEVPVGAVLVRAGAVLGEGYNQPVGLSDPTAHAEIAALRAAAAAEGNYRLPGSTLYVTLEPCAMCAGALVQARVQRVVFGAYDPRAGAAGSLFQILNDVRLNHRAEVRGGVLAESCGELLSAFFRDKRRA
ncbi:tRNA adenosine(34) deaminase TadA [Immundisolibacter sp.]|uniref:tRNA adenosine(34) deaminase TadA n=1 Tax=Immundisolibacter sp. TaxID=1934948 RepID=UPI0035625796